MNWLADTRASYDADAESYADEVRDSLAGNPFLRAPLTLFADLVHADGGGPVADVGCGPGHVVAYLRGLDVDAFGVDLSPGMIEVARRDHPGMRFEVGSMTDLDIADASLAGVLAWWSLIHVPDDEVPAVLAQFRRVLRQDGRVLLGFHTGDRSRPKTDADPTKMRTHRRQPELVAGWLADAGFTVDAQTLIGLAGPRPGAVLFARK
ncbi:methyltransferase family protein [Herbihabitans rhizosphaerae]|uniref:Methyltransferase family protein n=1 Tax=Herbihabitans rhizosphaerae TaxID=1872711 RepID=A0A4Q7KDX2_9PSEU|nr:class I SAM-dependent methyltransferase [Herbihabitans rhizosphaerae]RZS32425.1 methyltransferase family protein [Herbihabitans rhizosphaerae]